MIFLVEFIMNKRKKKGGRPSIKNPSYWINQLPQFDPTLYQTEEQYHNVFKGTYPKTWEKVPGEIKKMITDYYYSYGETGTDEKRQKFQSTYQQVPAESVPFQEPLPATNAAIQTAENELQISRQNAEPQINPDSFALAALEEQKRQESAQRKTALYNDLATGTEQPEKKSQKDAFQSEDTSPLKDAAYQAEDPHYGSKIAAGTDEPDKYKNAFKAYQKKVWLYQNVLTQSTGGSARMINGIKKKFDDMVGEPGSFDKMQKKYKDLNPMNQFNPQEQAHLKAIGKIWNHPYFSNLFQHQGRKTDYLKRYSEASLNNIVRKINEVMGGGYDWLKTDDRGPGNIELSNQFWSGDKQQNMIEQQTFSEDTLEKMEFPTDAPEAPLSSQPYTLDAEGNPTTEDPDKAFMNKKAKTVMQIAGHKLEDPLHTMRPGYGLAGGELLVPENSLQTTSDVVFDMFSVVPPGFGNGDTNKLFLQQQSWEKFVKHGGKMFGPNSYDGPTAGITPMPMQWTRTKPQAYIDQKQRQFDRKYSNALNTMQKHTALELSSGALPNDFAYNSIVSSKSLPRNSVSVLQPVVHNAGAFAPAFDPPAFARTERRRRLYDPVRHPYMKSYSQEANRRPYPRSLATKEILA